MIEVTGDLWTYPADVRIITTNGFVKKNGEAVMGRGCALELAKAKPEFPAYLGARLKHSGNVVHIFAASNIITFPVKHNWRDKADLTLIQESTDRLYQIVTSEPYDKLTFVMPRPGCGNGRLDWSLVKPIVSKLPDNVKVITYATI